MMKRTCTPASVPITISAIVGRCQHRQPVLANRHGRDRRGTLPSRSRPADTRMLADATLGDRAICPLTIIALAVSVTIWKGHHDGTGE